MNTSRDTEVFGFGGIIGATTFGRTAHPRRTVGVVVAGLRTVVKATVGRPIPTQDTPITASFSVWTRTAAIRGVGISRITNATEAIRTRGPAMSAVE